ncbi:MAG: alpha/beta hydrolase [Planctomycetes bacterium]|nr:alpha/beta hydrolase [Planctomycetota bacterium]
MELPWNSLLGHWVWDAAYRNWALISMVSTLIVLVVVPTLILRKYVKIVRNILEDTPSPPSLEMVAYERIEGERLDFRSYDGHALSGMMLAGNTEGPARGLIIFAHEFSSDAYSCARYCVALLAAGYDVMTFDFRGHGRSGHEEGYKPRQWPSDREQSDMLGAIAYAEDYLERRGKPRRLGLLGISRGAGAAILGAMNIPSIQAIVTDSAFSTDTTLEHLMKRWATIFAKVQVVAQHHPPVFWRFLRWLLLRECRRKFGCRFPSVRKAVLRLGNKPIFLIHGERDSLIPYSQSQLLYDLAQGPKHLWIVPGAKHNQSVDAEPEQYADRVVRFFDEHLIGDSPNPLPRGVLDEGSASVATGRPIAKVTGKRPWERLPM